MYKQLDIKKGDRYGRLTIIKEVERIYKTKRRFLCKCDCGNTKEINLGTLSEGNTKSCGCLKIEKLKKDHTTHGMNKKRIRRIWVGIKSRCNKKTNKSYQWYGGRGITHDPRWEKFENFYEDMKEGYEDHLTIDRKDNDGNYCKDNCRWVTMKKQNGNKRNTIKLTYNGKTKTLKEWSYELGIPYLTIRNRYYNYDLPVHRILSKETLIPN